MNLEEEEEEDEDDYVLEPHKYLTNNEIKQSHSTSPTFLIIMLALPNVATTIVIESLELKQHPIK